MTPRLFVALLLPLAARAQLVLVSVDGTTESPVGSTYDFASVAASDAKDVRFRARNTGSSAVTVTTLAVNGAGFTVDRPSLPFVIAPGNFLGFTVHFAAGTPASYSAALQVNTVSVILLARSVLAPALTIFPACTADATTATVNFPRVPKGSMGLCNLSLQNPYSQALTVSNLVVTGDAAFQGPLGVRMPMTLQPGQAVTFTVQFAPVCGKASYSGALTINSRTYPLAGSGFDPPLPEPILKFDSAGFGSAQQRTLAISLPTAYPCPASGYVHLAFTPDTQVVTDDPAILFVATGGRTVPFSVNQGDTQVLLGSQAQAIFQTGTTSGALRFTLDAVGIGIDGAATTVLTIPRTAVSIGSAGASRRVNDLDVELIGYDNTYTAGVMSFTFFDAGGNAIGPGAIRADFTADFRAYFTRIQSGSAFVMRATFPVTGDARKVAGVEVELTNSAGVFRTQRILFQ